MAHPDLHHGYLWPCSTCRAVTSQHQNDPILDSRCWVQLHVTIVNKVTIYTQLMPIGAARHQHTPYIHVLCAQRACLLTSHTETGLATRLTLPDYQWIVNNCLRNPKLRADSANRRSYTPDSVCDHAVVQASSTWIAPDPHAPAR
jgi:hypothetical protein